MESKSQDSIQVCIRIRPDKQDQIEIGTAVQYTDKQIYLDKNRFAFDRIFPPCSTQEDIFNAIGQKVITHTLDGYNGCIFVYGQTGSGKTYTMMGDDNGLMQKSFVKLFSEIQSLHDTQCIISCSYYEIYNEQIIDLLDPQKDKKLNIRQDIKKGVVVQNLSEQTVYSSHKLLEFLEIGLKNRHVGSTMMNNQSSRSHSIFSISLSIQTQVNGRKVLKTPKLHFVDLAGSERQKKTEASGDRLKEANNINKSLSALGMVINALTSQKTRSHIPYRDSKLTNLLRDSLGGNSKTFIIATISRAISSFQETLSTLNFANRAKMVKVKAQINEQSLSNNIEIFKQQIKLLKTEILRLKSLNKSCTPDLQQWMPKFAKMNTPQLLNYDTHFKQINDKISVISDQLAKSSAISPSFQQIIKQVQKSRCSPSILSAIKTGQYPRDMDVQGENQDMEVQQLQQNNAQASLINYLSTNNSLLESIHEKIQEYLQLKGQLHSQAYRDQMIIKQLKTPSKFQRDQYEQIIQNRNIEIQRLYAQIQQIKNNLLERDIILTNLQQEKQWKLGTIQQQDETILSYNQQQAQYKKQRCTLKNIISQQNEQIQINCKKINQLTVQCRQNKQLYIYAQQNWDTQKSLRQQVQHNLFAKIHEIQQLEKQCQQKIQYNKQYYEQLQQAIKQQNMVLSQTIDFSESMIADYQQQLKQYQTQHQKLKHDHIQAKLQQDQNNIKLINTQLSVEAIQKQYNYLVRNAQNMQIVLQQQIKQAKNQIVILTVHKLQYQNQSNQTITRLNNILRNLSAQKQQLSQKYNILDKQKMDQKIKLEKYLLQLQQGHEKYISDLQSKYGQQLRMYQQQLKSVNQASSNTKFQLEQCQQTLIRQKDESQSMQNQLNNRLQSYQSQKDQLIHNYQTQKKKIVQQNHKVYYEVGELRKIHKQLIRQNYKLKSRCSNTGEQKLQQMISKVQYYEQKFKLMSNEYQKAVQIVNKSKQKQIRHLQKIAFLEQSAKVKNNQMNQAYDENLLKQISIQNKQLKCELERMKMSVNRQSKNNYMKKKDSNQCVDTSSILQQKQQYFRSKIIGSISRWAPSKQNVQLKNRSLEQLIRSWQQIECESVKHLQAITKGIKKQQKLKMQNNMIVKQNLYFREEISRLEKQIVNINSQPRKLVKMDQSQPMQ